MEHSVDFKKIQQWGINIFVKSGLSQHDAEIISNALVTTSLWGIDSHGIARITHYLTRLQSGTINKKPEFKFVQTAAASGQFDGDDGHGILIMTHATEQAITLARNSGVGAVGVYNSSHCGAIGLYTRQIAQANMVGIAFTQADSLVVPHGGRMPFFGTNPISIAFPTENASEPICLDMATSIVPWNYVMNARREKTTLAKGIGVDKYGNESQDPEEVIGVRPMGEHKGYGLAFLIDMLCGPLNGMGFGPNLSSMYGDLDKKRKLGSLVLAIDPERFGGKETIRITGTAMINRVKEQGVGVLYPGEPEYISRKLREKNGIPVSAALAAEFRAWSETLNVTPLI